MSAADPVEAPARVGRQRDPAADAAILAAALELLDEVGYGALTMASVIERAGVSSATLYRRWPAKHDLVAAALESLAPAPVRVDKGSLERDLLAFAKLLGQAMAAREAVLERLVIDLHLHPELTAAVRAKLVAPRLEALAGILRRAVERGELTRHPPVEVVLSLLAGPIYHRAAGMGEPITPAFLRTVATNVLHGLRGGGAPAGGPGSPGSSTGG